MSKSLRRSAGTIAAAATLVGAVMWPSAALAHGARDYSVIEYHYVQVGAFVQAMPYAQHQYYCDGHYEFTPGPGGSMGLAYTQTYYQNEC